MLMVIFEQNFLFDLRAGVFNLYSLIYPSANFKSKIYPSQPFYIFSLLQMLMVVGKSVNFSLKKFTPRHVKFTPKAGVRNLLLVTSQIPKFLLTLLFRLASVYYATLLQSQSY